MEIHWCHLDESQCACLGKGWAQVDAQMWKECPVHFEGQLHPDTRTLLLDEPPRLAEEERRSRLRFQISEAKETINNLQLLMKEQQKKLVSLELELINRTETVRGIPTIRPEDMMHDK